MAKLTVTLRPGESKVASFEFTPSEAKVYQVTVDGLSGSFEALLPAVTAEIIEFSKPSAVYSGNPFTTTVRWRNTSDIAYAFDIVGAYGRYPGAEYYAGAVYDVLVAPGEEKITVVSVPTIKGDKGLFDVWVQIADAKKPYPYIEKSYAVKVLDNGVRIG